MAKKATDRKRKDKPGAAEPSKQRAAGAQTNKPSSHESQRTKPDSQAPAEKGKPPCPVVGVGASAGGLEALQRLLGHMPADSHLALVVIQHRAHDRQSMMSSLLQKHTGMKIEDVTDRTDIRTGGVYLAPADKDISIMHGALHCSEPTPHRGPPLPIDHFFRSLAQDQAERAVGIVLSGTGSDGTLGLKEIKAAGGMVIVQDPRQASYDQMPRNAIDTGLIDYVCRVEEMPKELVSYLKHPYVQVPAAQEGERKLESQLQRIFLIIRTETGHDFSHYKRNTIKRRVGRRLAVHQIENLNEYVGYLRSNSEEVEILSKELLITVTAFFRDHEAFEALAAKAIRPLIQDRPPSAPIRVWVPGCATGEEAYSVAMLIYEQMHKSDKIHDVQVFGTDLDEDAVERARCGRYPKGIAGDVSKKRLQQFFSEEDSSFRIKSYVREMLVFARHNLIKEPPFSKLDLICCRNVLIYMDTTLQQKVLPIFHYALNPGGYLFLGESESIGGFADLFEPVEVRHKIFRRKEGRAGYEPHRPDFQVPLQPAEAPDESETGGRHARRDIAALAERFILREYSAPCVLVDQEYNALYFNGDTSRYLMQPGGEPTLNLLQMARPQLHHKLAGLLQRAAREHHKVIEEDVPVGTDEEHSGTDIIVRPLRDHEGEGGLMLVVFRPRRREDQGRTAREVLVEEKDARIQTLEQEIQSTREYLQTTIEELETSNEELKSANEELQSTNEELQSTNEELDTSREELQSTNEELRSVNAEHQAKIDELSKNNDDMNNLLGCTEVATLFLDSKMRIRRFTPQARKLFRLIEGDIDRPLQDITTVIEYDDFVEDVQNVIDSLERVERELCVGDETWYIMRVLPYRTGENVIDGVVVTFVDITPQKHAALASARARCFAEAIVETIREPLIVLDSHLKIVSANDAFYRTFQVKIAETEGRLIYELGNRQWDIAPLRELLEKVIPQNTRFHGFVVEHDFPHIGHRKMVLNGRQVVHGDEKSGKILLAFDDVTESAADRE